MNAATDTLTPPVPPRSLLIRLLVKERDYRRPRFWMRLRLACASWNLVLGLALLSASRWIGQYSWLGLISLAGAALLFTTAFHLRRFIQN